MPQNTILGFRNYWPKTLYNGNAPDNFFYISRILLHDELQCKAWYCECMSFVRLSVRPSVRHTGGKSWKLTARTISPTPLLFVARRPSTYSERTWGNFGQIDVGWGKVACWSTKAAISPKLVKIGEQLLWSAYRNSPTLFLTVPSPTPCGLFFPKIGGSKPHPKLQSLLSQERVKLLLRISNLAGTFIGSIRTNVH